MPWVSLDENEEKVDKWKSVWEQTYGVEVGSPEYEKMIKKAELDLAVYDADMEMAKREPDFEGVMRGT